MIISENNIEFKSQLTPMQEGMFFHYMLGKNNNVYYNQLKFDMSGRLNIQLFVKAYDMLIKKHQALRTVFSFEEGDKPVQIILREVEGRISTEDISELSRREQDEIIENYACECIKNGSDLFEELPMVMKIFVRSDELSTVVWGCHHIIMDGWSMGIAARDIFGIYQQLINGNDDVDADVSYSEYLNWLNDSDKQSEMKYWQSALADCPDSPQFPESEHKKDGFAYARYTIELNEDTKNAADNAARSLRITANAFYQAVWGVLVSKYNNANSAVWGTVVSGRYCDVKNIGEMVGLAINTMPITLKYDDGSSFEDVCRDINMSMLRAEINSHVQLADIQKSVGRRALVNHAVAFENIDITQMLCGMSVGDININNAEIYDATSFERCICCDSS